MKKDDSQPLESVVKIISQERNRTNILRTGEHKLIAFLVQRIPSRISSDMLSGIGFFGSIVILLSFILARVLDIHFLLLGVFGFMINWFGDSLDGRLAYYRNKPRKWYGFSLDLTTDWIGAILIGLGFVIYAKGISDLIGFAFVVLYGWEMMTTLIRYKITGEYSIDSGIMGPTEVRIIISAFLILEVIFTGTISYFLAVACVAILIYNILDFRKLLIVANERDNMEREQKLSMKKRHV